LSSLIKRSFSLAGHRTSVALEIEFWEVLIRTAETRGQSLSAMVAAVDAAREPDGHWHPRFGNGAARGKGTMSQYSAYLINSASR
jgi:predicted DNA-binding ribbon-helix-helix protein